MMVGDLLRGALRVVPLPIPAPPRPAGLILPADPPPSPAAAAFVASLRDHIAEIAARGFADMPGLIARAEEAIGRAGGAGVRRARPVARPARDAAKAIDAADQRRAAGGDPPMQLAPKTG